MSDRMTDGANALLNRSSARGIKWEEIGKNVWVTGNVNEHGIEQCRKWDQRNQAWSDELDTWDNGDPKMQICVEWATNLRDPEDADDTGLRNLRSGGSSKPGSIIGAIKAALAQANAPGLEHGADLGLMWADGEGRAGDPRQFVAAYKRPVTPVPGNGAPPVNPFEQATPTTPPAPAPAPQPAAPQAAPAPAAW